MTVTKLLDEIDVRSFGAVGDGVADDTAAIDAAMAAGFGSDRNVVFPSGIWNYSGAGYDPSAGTPDRWFTLRGTNRQDSVIKINNPATYLIDATGNLGGFTIKDLRIVDGAGLIRHSAVPPQNFGASTRAITRVDCWGFNVCAINSNNQDAPNWHISECGFEAADIDDTIAIALGERHNGSSITKNYFTRARYNVKLRGGGVDVQIDGNDFARYPSGTTQQRADIWIIPTDAPDYTETVNVTANKFGKENFFAGDSKILIAAELAPVGDNGETQPDLTAIAPGRVRGLFVTRNHFGWQGIDEAPIYSYCQFVEESSWVCGNDYDGANTSTIVAFDPVTGSADITNEWMSGKDGTGGYRRLAVTPGGGTATWV